MIWFAKFLGRPEVVTADRVRTSNNVDSICKRIIGRERDDGQGGIRTDDARHGVAYHHCIDASVVGLGVANVIEAIVPAYEGYPVLAPLVKQRGSAGSPNLESGVVSGQGNL